MLLLLLLLLPHLSCWQELLKCAGTAREDPPCESSHLRQPNMYATNRSELKATTAALYGKQYRAVSCCFKLAGCAGLISSAGPTQADCPPLRQQLEQSSPQQQLLLGAISTNLNLLLLLLPCMKVTARSIRESSQQLVQVMPALCAAATHSCNMQGKDRQSVHVQVA